MSKPKSKINILAVPLNSRYEHTFWFETLEDQTAYMLGQSVYTFVNYTFIRRTWDLHVGVSQEVAEGWRYLTFTNSDTGKRYYYFINKVEYVNDSSTKLSLEMDVLQTYLFDYDLRQCFIERTHTRTDNVGDNTVPEGLEMGTYYNYHQYNLQDIAEMGILVLSAVDLLHYIGDNYPAKSVYMKDYNGVYSGLGVYAFNDAAKLEKQLQCLDEVGKAGAIVAIWMYPKALVTVKNYDGTIGQWSEVEWKEPVCLPVEEAGTLDTYLAAYDNINRMFEGYTPNNNKLYTHPFNLLYVTNNQGETAEYKFEHLHTIDRGGGHEVYNFHVFGAISPDGGVKLCPVGYNTYGTNVGYDEGLSLTNFPPCAWDSDTYKVWLAQNYNQLRHTTTTGAVTAATGLVTGIAMAATGNVMGAAGGLATAYHGVNQIAGVMAQKKDAEAQPPQAKGSFSTTVNVAAGRQTFTFVYKSLRKEYAQAIDQFFDRYGYAYHKIEVPTLHNRERYTYIKTMGCCPVGNVCNEDLLKIASIFDNGVTFWADTALLGYYGNNPTLS